MRDPEGLKKAHREFYDQVAPVYGKRRLPEYAAILATEIDRFAGYVREIGDMVVDLGSGPGTDSLELSRRGLEVVCVDISEEMVKACRDKGLEAHQMDFYHLDFPAKSFDGAWMAFALLHVPKEDADLVLEQVWRILKNKGRFYLALYEGEGEKEVPSVGAPGTEHKVFKAFYREEEIAELLSRYFEITRRNALTVPGFPTSIFFECRKKRRIS